MTRNQRFAGLYLSICAFFISMDLARAQVPAAAQRTEARSVPAPKWVEMIDQGEADPRLKGIRTPRGIRVEIVAAEPAVENPVAMAFGEDGTLIVLERTLSKEKPELLKGLRDIDGDGVYEKSRILMSDLSIASGLLMNGGWIYWTSEGRVLRRRAYDAKLLKESQVSADDKTGPATKATADGKWIEQVLVHGLSGVIPYQAGGLTLGPDGWLFVSAGSGDQRAESWDGSAASVVRKGAVFRFRPDGSQLHEFCRGLCQPTGGIAFDPWGNAFAADMDWRGDKPTGTRLLYLVEGGDYGWQHAKVAAAQPDQVRAAAWGERPGTLPGMLPVGNGSPSGVLAYYGSAFPKFFQGHLICPDPDSHVVRALAVDRDGATFRVVSQFELMSSSDGLFRPCQAIQGPDGAIYIANAPTDGRQGRIYRLSWSGTKDIPAIPLVSRDSWAKVASAGDDELWAALGDADYRVQQRAADGIVAGARRNKAVRAKTIEKLTGILSDATQPLMVRGTAIRVASQLNDKSLREAFRLLLTDKNRELQLLAAEAIVSAPPTEPEELELLTGELKATLGTATNPAVARALHLALGKLASKGDIDLAEWGFEGTSVNFGPKVDRYVFDGHVRALEMCPGAAKELMLGNLDVALNFPVTEPQERQRIKQFVVATAESMRTRELSIFLDALLRGEEDLLVKMEAPLEVRLIATYRNVQVDPPINADAVLQWLDKHPGGPVEVELAALETVSLIGTTKPDALSALADRLLAKPTTAALVARRLLSGNIDRSLLPKVKDALRSHAASDPTGELQKLIKDFSQEN